MKRYIGFVLVLLFGVIAAWNLLTPGFAHTQDGQDQIARIANFYINLQQGVLIPRWAPNLNWGYGHPVLEFLYPFPSYLSSLFHVVGFSLVDSTKIVFALGMIFSGIAMYLFITELWGGIAGLTSGVLYMFAPYRFVDLYVRGDIGENLAFVFMPLMLWAVTKFFRTQKRRYTLIASISLALLILSHNAVSLLMLPLICLYIIHLLWQHKWKRSFTFESLFLFIEGFALASFFWVPALLEGKYTLRNIVTKGEYITRFVHFQQLVYGQWNYGQQSMFTVQLGLVHWTLLLCGILLCFISWKKAKKDVLLVGGAIIFTFIAIFFMLPESNIIWEHVMLLQNFQFPWRFLAIPVFTTSLIGGFCIAKVTEKGRIAVALITVLILFGISVGYMHARGYVQEPEGFFTGIYAGTTDTGESSPIWSTRGMEMRYKYPLVPLTGKASILDEKRLVTMHTYTVTVSKTTRMLENTLYFPGWSITVDGKPVAIQYQDPAYRGLMTFFVPQGSHTILISYSETRLRLLGDVISLIGLVLLLGFGIQFFRKKSL